MYVTTFYSFKGGVGRTMALVNTAVELARRGRRVLAVDFDLEAPGLDTFDVLRPAGDVPGIIDFVGEYLVSKQAPNVERFISQAPGVGAGGGELWIMPSGAQRATYAADFSRIDWGALYDQHDGYLLFEDLKEQWKQVVRPDYVLIDSRTGHTDTGGICTRQLPDAVAILFFPNDQNLRGLSKVVHDIRAESRESRTPPIDLHFVMSNVPDLDDEDRILEAKIDAFREQLDFRRGPLVVHRYDSLSLLNQVVFTKDRPRSRLAREYCDLLSEIVSRNLADRDGALDYLGRASRSWRRRGVSYESPNVMDRKLEEIERVHARDGEVLFALGAFLEDYRRRSESVAPLFDRAIAAGHEPPQAYLKRAHFRADSGDAAGAGEDALRVLRSDDVSPPLVREAIALVAPDDLGAVADSVAVVSLSLDDKIWIASTLEETLDTLGVAVSILEPILEDRELGEQQRDAARSVLALRHIGIGKCKAAAKLLRDRERGVADMDMQDAFNYGMAVWGTTQEIAREPFSRVVELDREDDSSSDPHPNYLQCLPGAHRAGGGTSRALELARRAREALGELRGAAFSCWRYRRVPAREFLGDLDEIEALINGDGSRKPRFMRRAARLESDETLHGT